MFFQFFLILFISFLLSFSSQSSNLKLLVSVTRHGARSPLYNNFITSPWEIPPGQLTSVGQRQHYLLGRELKKRYINDQKFLNNSYNSDEIKVFSTDSTRTIQSAQSQLLGLFYEEGSSFNQSKMLENYVVPPINVENWQDLIKELDNRTLPFNYQPVPVRSTASIYDKILNPGENCPKIKKIIAENWKSEIYQNFEEKLRNMGFYQKFSEIFKVNASNLTIEETQQYLDIITMNKYDNRELPANYTEEFDNMMNFAYCFRQFYVMIGNESVLPYFISKFYDNLLKIIDEKMENSDENKLKFEFFSAHDNNLIYILRSLGLMNYTDNYEEFTKPLKFFSYRNPPLASILLFELEKTQEKFFVKVMFNDRIMQIKGCEKYCEVEKFKGIVKMMIFEDWEEKCEEKNEVKVIINKVFLENP